MNIIYTSHLILSHLLDISVGFWVFFSFGLFLYFFFLFGIPDDIFCQKPIFPLLFFFFTYEILRTILLYFLSLPFLFSSYLPINFSNFFFNDIF